MTQVFLSLGSNIEPLSHLRQAIAALRDRFGELVMSPVYESVAVGFKGDNFLNLVVALDTDLPVGTLSVLLREIEASNGRRRDTEKFASRTLDIDILTYGDTVGLVDGVALPRDEIERYSFVIKPLADIAGDQVYPVTGERYAEISRRLTDDDDTLWRVDVALEAAAGGRAPGP
jgi:2-amino-4-hydroxy-6-hydroxymethyldihydropteridine diphosphokinase